jgi:hypothetical protein
MNGYCVTVCDYLSMLMHVYANEHVNVWRLVSDGTMLVKQALYCTFPQSNESRRILTKSYRR